MAMTKDDILIEAQQLSVDDREFLAREIVRSLPAESAQVVEEAWDLVIEQRVKAYERGESTTVDVETIMRQAREIISKAK